MNNQFEKMQKLAFGKAITENNPQSLTESSLKDKIKELVHSSLGEAKKKKKKEADVAPQEDIIDMGMNMDTPSDTIAPASTDEIDIDTIEWTDEQVIYLEEVQTGKIYTFHPELY